MDDWTVFNSMKEFWLWVVIVTLIVVLLGFTLLSALHMGKQLRKTEAILIRAEQLEKKKPKLEPKEDDE